MKKTYFWFTIGIMLLISLVSCNIPSPQQTPMDPTPDLDLILTQIAEEYRQTTIADTVPTSETEPDEAPTPEPTAVPVSKETLTVCLGKEPSTLFFYDESSQAMWSVLEAIYNGPFDMGDGTAEPVIFEEIIVSSEPVEVIRGDIIVDIQGNPVEMKPGVRFMPYETAVGCVGIECLSTWTAVRESAVMSKTVITFRLKENLFWNDGTPLTAADSVYSMGLNGTKGINASKRAYNLTESYTAPDDYTVIWQGLPGYSPADPSEVFWTPLPSHQMAGMSLDAIRDSEMINRTPLGWGAWQIVSWESGSQIIAERNPYYVSDSGTEPFFDTIVYQFYGTAGDNNLQALHSGTCDIIDTSVDMMPDLEAILEDVRDGYEAVYIRPELTRQELVLNLAPAAYGTQQLLTSTELRTAIVQCIDREAIIKEILLGQSEIPSDFYPEAYSAHDPNQNAFVYDPEAAIRSLEEQGWTLSESEEVPLRIASAVPGIRYGTELAFTLYTSDSVSGQKAGEMIRADLEQCGIKITHEALPLGKLYAQGPDGVIFGRTFDMALFAWSSSVNPCAVYRSDQIPDDSNHWIGTNVGGYVNEAYDEACLLPALAETDARQIFSEDLPAIPLYFGLSIGVSSNKICGLSDKIGSRSILWNLEYLTRSADPCAISQWNNIYQ